MDATVRFYEGVLGLPLIATDRRGPLRWYFFLAGPNTFLNFLEVPNDDSASGIRPPLNDGRRTEIEHFSLNCPDDDSLLRLRGRLREFDCEVTDVRNQGHYSSIYFCDPHGLLPEASAWHGVPTADEDRRWYLDPEPVAAVQECSTGETFQWLPKTSFDANAALMLVLYPGLDEEG
jgi:catechol 2,3-dioxygenase-like lactoylglutathione lyase family enzyme